MCSIIVYIQHVYKRGGGKLFVDDFNWYIIYYSSFEENLKKLTRCT